MTLDRKKRNMVDSLIEDALGCFCQDADSLVSRGLLTEREVTEALIGSPDFDDAWQDYTYEGYLYEGEKGQDD